MMYIKISDRIDRGLVTHLEAFFFKLLVLKSFGGRGCLFV